MSNFPSPPRTAALVGIAVVFLLVLLLYFLGYNWFGPDLNTYFAVLAFAFVFYVVWFTYSWTRRAKDKDV